MPIKNSESQYGFLSKLFHWSMAFLILGMLLSGFYFDKVSYSSFQFQLLSLHKSFGLLILYLVGARILWMAYTKKPQSLASHNRWEVILAHIVHIFLYIAMIGLPVSGFIMSQSGGNDVGFFGLEMPQLFEKDRGLNRLSYLVHEYLAFMLIGAILLHVAGGIKHHFIDRDQTLRRMMGQPFGIFLVFTLLIFLGWLALLSWLLLF